MIFSHPGDVSRFDESALLTRLLNDRELVAEILRGFLADFPRQLRLLSERLEQGDAEGAWRQAHKVKGAAGSVAARMLHAVVLKMERAAKEGDLNTASEMIPSAYDELRRFREVIKATEWCCALTWEHKNDDSYR